MGTSYRYTFAFCGDYVACKLIINNFVRSFFCFRFILDGKKQTCDSFQAETTNGSLNKNYGFSRKDFDEVYMYKEYPKSGESRFEKLWELLKLANLLTYLRTRVLCAKLYVKNVSSGFFSRMRKRKEQLSLFKIFVSIFPIFEWLPKYKWHTDLIHDIISGLTVAIIHIPQGNYG